jgi:hypothetical protein
MANTEEISERHSVVEIEFQIERAEADLAQSHDSQADGTKHNDVTVESLMPHGE